MPKASDRFDSKTESSAYELPERGGDPSRGGIGTTPGSFAQPSQIGGPLTFSSPDAPGMPPPSSKTAWDFMPPDWHYSDGRWHPPTGFEPVTQLEHARLGMVTAAMRRVAEREAHLTAEQIRDEVGISNLR